MPPDPSIHDNDVYAYSVDCAGRRLILHTVFDDDAQPHEFTDVLFRDVVAHHLERVLEGNILFDVEEIAVELLVREEAALFANSWRYGWPPVDYKGDLDALIAALRARPVRAYRIGSSYGLTGWVLAGSCETARRDGPVRVG